MQVLEKFRTCSFWAARDDNGHETQLFFGSNHAGPAGFWVILWTWWPKQTAVAGIVGEEMKLLCMYTFHGWNTDGMFASTFPCSSFEHMVGRGSYCELTTLKMG